MSRIGKIARLPFEVRDQLNRRLQDGELGKDLVVWLNSLPNVQALLKAEFGERPVNDQNLSDWRAGGYDDWVVQQETMAQARQMAANAEEFEQVSKKTFNDHLSTCLAARYAVELRRLEAEAKEEDRGCDLGALHKLCRQVVALRRGDHDSQRLRMEQQRLDLVLAEDARERAEEFRRADAEEWERARMRELETDEQKAKRKERWDEFTQGCKEDAAWEAKVAPYWKRSEDPEWARYDFLSDSPTTWAQTNELGQIDERMRKRANAAMAAAKAQGVSGGQNQAKSSSIKANQDKSSLKKSASKPKGAAEALTEAKTGGTDIGKGD